MLAFSEYSNHFAGVPGCDSCERGVRLMDLDTRTGHAGGVFWILREGELLGVGSGFEHAGNEQFNSKSIAQQPRFDVITQRIHDFEQRCEFFI